MGTLEDVAAMRREGRPDSEISAMLKQRGLTDQEISNVLTHTTIRDAVSGYDSSEDNSGMSPSIMSPDAAPAVQAQAASQQGSVQEASQDYASAADSTYAQAPQAYGDYSYAQQYAPSALGTDLISEIADQVVTEKLSPIIAGVDKIMDMRSTVEAQMKYLDERLKRIEKIIDRLQLSLLQRVGEYVSNVEDIKREMLETQKTFKALVDRQ